MTSKCVKCNVDFVERKDYKMMISVKNPIQIPIIATFKECPSCGERVFEEEEGLRVVEFVDKVLKEGSEVEAKVGTKLKIVDK